jgi:hypothetical protein
MANQILSMNKLKEILRYQIEGKSKREISKRTELSRNTVEKYLSVFDSHPLTFKELLNLSDLELHSNVIQPVDSKPQWDSLYVLFPSMEIELKCVGMTRRLIWERYKRESLSPLPDQSFEPKKYQECERNHLFPGSESNRGNPVHIG